VRVIDTVRRSGIGIRPEQTIADAAAIMENTGVGSLAVVQGTKPVGIVTDRDLVRRALARQMPCDARVDAVMSSPVVTIDAEADLHETLALFRTHGFRRLAVVKGGQFAGMVTVGDLFVDLAYDLVDLSRPISSEIHHAHRNTAVPVTT
jgi:CBS domain-containing protein